MSTQRKNTKRVRVVKPAAVVDDDCGTAAAAASARLVRAGQFAIHAPRTRHEHEIYCGPLYGGVSAVEGVPSEILGFVFEAVLKLDYFTAINELPRVCRAWRNEWNAKKFQYLITTHRYDMYNVYEIRPTKIFGHTTSLVKADPDGGFWSVRNNNSVTHTNRIGKINDAYFAEDDMVNAIAFTKTYLFVALGRAGKVVRVCHDGTKPHDVMHETLVTKMAALCNNEIVIQEGKYITLYKVGDDKTYPLGESIPGSNLTSSRAGVAWICPPEDESTTTIQWVTKENRELKKLKFKISKVFDIAIGVINPLVASISTNGPASITLSVERIQRKTKKIILNYSSGIRLWAMYKDLVLLTTMKDLVVLNTRREVATFIALPHSYTNHACFTSTGKIVIGCECGIFVY